MDYPNKLVYHFEKTIEPLSSCYMDDAAMKKEAVILLRQFKSDDQANGMGDFPLWDFTVKTSDLRLSAKLLNNYGFSKETIKFGDLVEWNNSP